MKTLSYADSGVNIEAGNALIKAIKPFAISTGRPGADAKIGAFGGLFDLREAGYQDPILVAANDGVGTKLRIAIESGMHDTVGVDLVAMCVNDLVTLGAEPLFFLDYFAVAELDVTQAANVISGIARGCKQAGCALIGGESAEMPGMYARGDYDLAGFAVGAVERGGLLPSGKIKQGDVILGLASCGVHSNGFSLVRKVIENKNLAWHDPTPFNESRNQNLAQALLEPTRIYVKSLLPVLSRTNAVHALAHITGGGIIENIPRALPDHFIAKIDLSRIDIPEVFRWLKIEGRISQSEMLRTFNCGVGMAVIVDCEQAKSIGMELEKEGERVFVIGEVASRAGNDPVIFENDLNF